MKSLAITVLVTVVLMVVGVITVYKTPAPEDDSTKFVLRITPDGGTPVDAGANSPEDASASFDASPAAPAGSEPDEAETTETTGTGERDIAGLGADEKTPGRLPSWDTARSPALDTDPGEGAPLQRGRDPGDPTPFGRFGAREGLTPAEAALRGGDPESSAVATPSFTPFGGRIIPPSPWNMDVAPETSAAPGVQQQAEPETSQEAASEQDLADENPPSQSAALTPAEDEPAANSGETSGGASSAGLPENPARGNDPAPLNAQDWAAITVPPPVKAPPTPEEEAAAKLPPPPVPKKRASSQPPIPRDTSSSLVTSPPVQTAIAEQRNAALVTSSITDAVAAPFAAPASGPRIAIIVRDLGMDENGTAAAINTLSPAVTLGFSPYGRATRDWAQKATQKGHDLFAGVPMEPAGDGDESPPNMLLASLSPEENLKRLDWALAHIENPAGVINIMGGKLSQTPDAIKPFIQSIKERGLTYVDDGAAAHPFAILLAAQLQVPYRIADSRIDDDPSEAAVRRELDRLEDIARTKGSAIGIARATPETIRQLVLWSATLEKKRISLVPASQIVEPVNLP